MDGRLGVGFRGGKVWLCRLGLVGLGVRWVCRGDALLELLTELADLEALLRDREAEACTVDWLVTWDGRGWSGSSADVGLEDLLELQLKIGLAGVGSTVGSLVVLGGTASCRAGLALIEAAYWWCWLPW